MTEHKPTRSGPPPRRGRSHPRSASTAEGIVAQRAALAERERRTARARTAARRLDQADAPRP